jgi:hypothetical protein
LFDDAGMRALRFKGGFETVVDNLLLAPWIVTHIFTDIEAGHRQDERILGRFEQVNQDSQQFVVLLVQAQSVFTPEFGRFVDGGPFQAGRM